MTQKDTVDKISDLMKDHKARNKIIKDERTHIAAEAERFGQTLLDARRALGIPDPDGAEWGQRMLQFQFGMRALAMGMQEEGFTVEGVPSALREWLKNPMTDRPASDEDIAMIIELIEERERTMS